MLWIDDDVGTMTGLHSYLSEVAEIHLHPVTNVDEAHHELKSTTIDLVLFDVVLLENDIQSSLDRRAGMQVAYKALGRGIRRFVCFTVLAETEVNEAWRKLVESYQPATDGIKFQYFGKSNASVSDVRDSIKEMLDIE